MDNLSQTITRKEIVEFLVKNALTDGNYSHLSVDMQTGYNFLLEHLIDEFGDNNLRFNSSTGFFDYVGPELPA